MDRRIKNKKLKKILEDFYRWYESKDSFEVNEYVRWIKKAYREGKNEKIKR